MSIKRLLFPLVLLLSTLITFSCGEGNDGIYEVTLILKGDRVEFVITGLNTDTDDFPPLGERHYFHGYPNSYITHRIDEKMRVQVVYVLSLSDYENNKVPDEYNRLPLPDGRAVPLESKFGGGDGVGNGRVHGGFTQLTNTEIAGIYQNGESIGFFYPREFNIGENDIVYARQNVTKRKGFVALVGKSQQGTLGGALLVLPEPKLK